MTTITSNSTSLTVSAVAGGFTIISTGFSPNAPQWSNSMKHVSGAFHPPSGRIYFHGGDYRPTFPNLLTQGVDQSYNQEMWSLDLAARLADPTNTSAGWVSEYTYVGFGGTSIQPKHPDFVPITWDPSRNVFWSVPGTYNTSPNVPIGGTEVPNTASSDPGYIWNEILQFNPAASQASRWSRLTPPVSGQGGPDDAPDTWWSIYDPLNDRLLRPSYSGGSGPCLNLFNCTTGAWATFRIGIGGPTGDWRTQKEYWAVDQARRRMYFGACCGTNPVPRIGSCSMDDFSMEDLGPIPGGPWQDTFGNSPPAAGQPPIQNYTMVLLNTKQRTLYFKHAFDGTFWQSPVDARPLVWTQIPVQYMQSRMGVYDVKNNLTLLAGGTDSDQTTNMYVYKQAIPAWATEGALPFGSVLPISLNNLQDVTQAQLDPLGHGFSTGNIVKSFAAWTSGIFAPDLGGPNGSLIFAGGGDADGWSTWAMAFGLDSQLWTRIKDQTTALNWDPAYDKALPPSDPHFFNVPFEEHGDGTPAAPHSYDSYEYLPPSAGGGPNGSLLRHISHIMYTTGETRISHRLQLGPTTSQSTWSRASTNTSAIGFGGQSICAYDPDLVRVWGFSTSNVGEFNNTICWLDMSAKTGVGTHSSVGLGNTYLLGFSSCMRFWRGMNGTKRYLIFVTGTNPNTQATSTGIAIFDLNNLGSGCHIPPTSGTWYYPLHSGLTWCAALGVFFAQQAGSENVIYRITPPASGLEFTGTWTVAQEVPLAGTIPATVAPEKPAGLFKRLHWHDQLRCLLIQPGAAHGVYAYRPAGV